MKERKEGKNDGDFAAWMKGGFSGEVAVWANVIALRLISRELFISFAYFLLQLFF